MMRWLRRGLLILLAVIAVLLVGGWAYVRFVVGAVVNTPVTGVLAEQFPSLFARPRADASVLAEHLRLPDGMELTVFARDIPDARILRVTRNGDVLLASPAKGAVWLLRADRNGDGASDGVQLLLRGLDGPNGLDFHGRHLYVAEEGQVGRIVFDHRQGQVQGAYEVVIGGLPPGGNHWKKTLRFGPDGQLYLAIGSTCNVCIEEDERRATLMRFAPDGTGGRIIATGLRNSAGFDWRPGDNALFATDNGRDLLGDDFPPCELNQVVEGGFYGWPFVNGTGIADPDVGAGHDAARARSPVFEFNAHNAPLGILFPRHLTAVAGLQGGYAGAALVALHGSWNRARKDGYKVVSLHWAADGRIEARDFLSGFLVGDKVYGRPAELAEGPDGAIYVSDDFTGAVYRIARARTVGAPAAGRVRTDAGAPAGPDAALVASLQAPGKQASGKQASGSVNVAAAPAPVPAASPAELAAQGERLFEGSGCLECHVLGAAMPPADGPAKVQLKGLAARYDVATMQVYLDRPVPPMPPVADEGERVALTHYLLQVAP